MKKNYLKIFAAALMAVGSLCAQAEEVVVLEENFDNLENAMKDGKHLLSKNPWTGTDAEGVSYQPNFTNFTNDGHGELLNGWSSVTGYLYPCQGFVRISKTNYGGDLVSPALSALNKATDVQLSYQAIGYTSNVTLAEDGSYKSGLKHDYQFYCVGVIGGGEIEGATKTKTLTFAGAEVTCAVMEVPTNSFITMDTTAAWGFEGTKKQLTIKGATGSTQIVFASMIPGVKTTTYATTEFPIATDAEHGVNNAVNRIIFDNIKVSYEEVPTAVEDINAAVAPKTRKVIENGQVYIIAGDKKFNVMGAEVK
ncbi:MAG: hypothetical protein Q4B68_10965 [Bacteroidales bacterium]|nr:hypothetical protein [Bacteroidales bacterium]